MTVTVPRDHVIELSGHCGAEDAGELQNRLLAAPGSAIEWGSCQHLHAAVIQVILVARPEILGTPESAFLSTHLAPILIRSAEEYG